MKKIVILSLVLSSILLSGCSCSMKKDVNNDDNNDVTVITDENVIGEQNVDGILLENTTFQVQDGNTTIVTKVTNNTGADYKLDNYQMVIMDKNGTVLTILTSTVNETLAPNEEKSYPTPFSLDLTNAAKVEYNINVAISE